VTQEPLLVRNLTRDSHIAARVRRANRPWSRLVGLLGRRRLAGDEGLLLVPCTSIHTAFMLFPIDVLYLNREHTVVKSVRALRPFRLSACFKGGHSVLELPVGAIEASGTQPGDRLAVTPSSA
jgi:uncharacterized membrane protein (UPF0127 family)